MKPKGWERIERLYHSALKVPADQRSDYLKQECPDSEEIREEVESLLSFESSAEEFIESPAIKVAAQLFGEEKFDDPESVPISPSGPSRFRILEKLGAGGMGVVYKAEDIKLRRTVALKFLPPWSSWDPEALERFQREAHAASALNHPNICTVYDVDEYEGQPFLAMELLEGQTLECLIGKQRLPVPELLDLSTQISDALAAAHSRGIIHRDIKPSNIFITTRGEAKILDFGLAKFHGAGPSDHRQNTTEQPARGNDPNRRLTLTRTGATIGTAAYMSPEQIRGKELDARTDLFSFGLVLYEMATGERPFKGQTPPELQSAILEQVPNPARQVNRELPASLENIIGKALKKDPEARYQFASDLRADLKSVKHAIDSKHSRRWLIIASAVTLTAVLLLAGTIFWTIKRRSAFPTAQPELKFQQLTTTSFENRVLNGAISPDGKYLAYADLKGMHIKGIATGATQSVPQPPLLQGKIFDWEINSTAWFPDSKRFLANARPPVTSGGVSTAAGTSIWLVSVHGGMPEKLRDNAAAYSISPDGSLISFGSNPGKIGDREIWLMKPDGEQAKKLYEVGEDRTISGLIWTPDGRRVIYFSSDGAPDGSTDRVVSRDLSGGPVTTLLSPPKLKKIEDLSFLPDGRLIYSLREPPPMHDACNYWITRIDAHTGQTIEQSRKLTQGTGFCMSSAGATADGKQFAFLQWKPYMTSYVGELASGGTRLLQLRHFPMDDTRDAVADWTADGKAILSSNLTGHFGIYKQSLDADTPEAIVTQGFGMCPRVTPDSKWILYLGSTRSGTLSPIEPEPVMRVSINGGPSQSLFTAKGWALISCARAPSDLCVLVEPSDDRQQAIVTTLDPLMGRGAYITRFPLNPNDNDWWVDLSPDGTRLATIQTPTTPIEVLSMRGQPARQIKVKGWSNFVAFKWAADGRSLFAVSFVRGRKTVLHVDLEGKARVLWESLGGSSSQTEAIPSPDGRHLAILNWTTESNIWMMENF